MKDWFELPEITAKEVLGDDYTPLDLIKRFPNLESTLDTGIRSMLVVSLESSTDLIGAIVIASFKPSAYTDEHMEIIRRISSKIISRVTILKGERTNLPPK